MHRLTRLFAFPLLALLASLFALPAYAYLDPGTGSMVLQAVLATVAAVAVALKLYWGRLKKIFTRERPVPLEEKKP